MNTEPVSVFIEGDNFLEVPTQHIGGEEPVTVDARFEAFLGGVALEDVTRLDEHTLSARVPQGFPLGMHPLVVVGPLGRRVEMPDAYFSSDRMLARLDARVRLQPTKFLVGERIPLLLEVKNTGGTAANAVLPVLRFVGEGQVKVITAPEPTNIDPGGSSTFSWELGADAPGDLLLTLEVRGVESTVGVELRAPAVEPVPIQIRERAVLTARFLPFTQPVDVGQEFDVELEVSNPGDTPVLQVEVQDARLEGDEIVSLVSWPESERVKDIPGKGRVVFSARLRATGEGSCFFSAAASGKDETDGTLVSAPRVSSSALIVQRYPSLSGSLSAPGRVWMGREFTVSLKVTNTGSSTVLDVRPVPPAASSGVVVVPVQAEDSLPMDLAGGASTTFTWRYRGARQGKVFFTGAAGGIDASSGASVSSGEVSSDEVSVWEVEPLLDDPLGDGSPFAQVLEYGGRLYLGPNRSGTRGVSVDLDGLGARGFSFFLHKDTTGNSSQNVSAAPYRSIGVTGCWINTPACGPDNENGRGFFFSGRVGTREWLGIGGARSGGDLDYVYLGQDTDDLGTMFLRYLDLSALLGAQTRGFSAAYFFKDRLYLGFPDTGGSRPYLLVIKNLPRVDPGYAPSRNMDAEDLRAEKMPGVGQGGTPRNGALMQMIDTLTGFNDRLYLANNGGCMRSTTPMPRSYGSAPGDWASCTPSLLAWTSRTGRTTTKTADLEPADRAVPQLAVFQGRLYLARNISSPAGVKGAQLFVCGPERTGSLTDCDPGDWSLVAPNSTGDTLLTQFNDPGNVSLSLLVATTKALYVGFDNGERGVVLLRAVTAAPLNRDDFKGMGDCSAAQYPAGCEGLGGNGLGVGATRVFDGRTIGGTGSVYLTAGDGTGPAGLFRLQD
ncbi:hypothetical protein JQX13_44570 [Archangium violaceum]|uniref:hypothetical protein n=1 Tax=Archangium violaceum TaxID=83451 RepID=UPI00193B03CE|nr:hypothetical protein [Archangium violaceum]QRK07057.1 hypothetical protein JQX13_44570 [Archangium violaceum]